MKMTNLFLVSIALTATLASESFAVQNGCNDFYSRARITLEKLSAQDPVEFKKSKQYFHSLIETNLLTYREYEIEQVASGIKYKGSVNLIPNAAIDALNAKHPNEKWNEELIVQELNEQSMKLLEAFRPDDKSDRRFDYLPTHEILEKMLASIDGHPVVGQDASWKYQQQGTEIGFCFGRGCYVDLALTKLGVDRDAIKKLWAVGPMGGGGNITWEFHIGTAVRLSDNKWYVIDNVSGDQPLTIREWGEVWREESLDQNLRLYISSADKFTASLGRYDRTQMGLDLDPRHDWYKGYFRDLLDWFRNTSLPDLVKFLKIKSLPSRPVPVDPSPEQLKAAAIEDQALLDFPFGDRYETVEIEPSDAPSAQRKSRFGKFFKRISQRLGF